MEVLFSPQQDSPNEKSCQTDSLEPSSDQPSQPSLVYCTEPGDPALFQRQLQTSKSGIQQIIECFRTGTDQLKHILLREVDTIFECRLCRSLFRGLPNLITHKEHYCLARLPQSGHPSDNGMQSLAMKQLLEAIYPRPDRPDYTVRLEPIASNQNAVYQHMTTEPEPRPDGPQSPDRPGSDAWPREDPRNVTAETDEGEQDGLPEDKEQSEGEEEMDDDDDDDDDDEEEEDEDEEEGGGGEEEEEDEEGRGKAVEVVIGCRRCGKSFDTRRGMRRHVRKVHPAWLEELRKLTETRTISLHLISVEKDRRTGAVLPPKPNNKRCAACGKLFATKANVRRHFDEVHLGLRREAVTPGADVKPGPQPEPAARPKRSYNLYGRRCLLCQRRFLSRPMLQRHMRLLHKVKIGEKTPKAAQTSEAGLSAGAEEKKEKEKEKEKVGDQREADRQEEEEPQEDESEICPLPKPKLTMGFDFKRLFCKLCKRQYSSRQSLVRHIVLHTDNGNDLFIKFFRCPLCRYESRRKRDVLRHVSVVHKKPAAYLSRIAPNLETRAVKKPAEQVLKGISRRAASKAAEREERTRVNGRCALASPHFTRKRGLLGHAAPSPASSPPAGRGRPQTSAHLARRHETANGTEARFADDVAPHVCDTCGRAFAKKVYLESHKRSHRNAGRKRRGHGVSTRSRALLW